MILALAEATLASGDEITGEESESRQGAILASVVDATILAAGEETISVLAEAPALAKEATTMASAE